MRINAFASDTLLVLGPTACGKTRLAVELARGLSGAVISVDSRQVYRGLDLCSGKDLAEYGAGPGRVDVLLCDCADLSETFSLYHFAEKVNEAADRLRREHRPAVFCGGTGLYLDALVKGYRLEEAAPDAEWRRRAESLDIDQLREELLRLRPEQHNQTDLLERGALVRAIEVARAGMEQTRQMPAREQAGLVIGLRVPLPILRERIQLRLRERLEQGMIEEVEALLGRGLPVERLSRLGLEARWITRLLAGDVNRAKLEQGLARDIYLFARRQLSWYRRMEQQGLAIHWFDPGTASAVEIMEQRQRRIDAAGAS